MKKLTFLGFTALLIFFACKKTPFPYAQKILPTEEEQTLRRFLHDSLTKAAYDSLDFTHVVVATRDTGNHYFVRVPFSGISVVNHFVLIRTDREFYPGLSAIVNIHQDTPVALKKGTTIFGFNGSIVKTWLNGTPIYHSPISGGFIQIKHRQIGAIEAADEPSVELPEIIIYAPDEDYYADWDLILESGDGGGYGYSSAAPVASGTAGGGGSATVNSFSFDVASELQASRPGINLQSYLDCFSIISNNGATYSAALCVRIPNPGNPMTMWNPLTGNVGHTFIQLTKTNGSQSITQYIGFYAKCGLCAIGGDPVDSKLVDNSGHPYDATLSINLSASQFSTLTAAMESLSKNDYSICDYNCTGYAVQAFNTILPDPLSPPNMTFPGGTAGDFPNSLYRAFEVLPADGPDGQVSLFAQDQAAGASHGACN